MAQRYEGSSRRSCFHETSARRYLEGNCRIFVCSDLRATPCSFTKLTISVMENLFLTRPGLKILAMCSIVLSLCSSCATSTSTPSDTTPTTGCGEGLLCATINGTSYIAEAFNPTGDWLAWKTEGSGAKLQDPYYTIAYHIDIFGGDSIHPQQSIEIGVSSNSPLVTGTYNLTNPTVSVSMDYYKFDANDLVFYDWRAGRNQSGSTGTVTISRLDTVANLVSGSFSFTAKNINVNTTHDSSTIVITNGSFTNLKITR